MQFTVAFAALATALAVAASPVKRGFDNYLYVCSDANWSGTCENVGFYNEQCTVFPGELQYDISSVGPPDGYDCYLWKDFTCDGDGIASVYYPGIQDLGDGNTNYNDVLNSFRCYPIYTGPE